MDLIGTRIRKNFQGFGIYNGIIESYEPATGFFKVLYEDGDSEDLELAEIQPILNEMDQVSQDSEQSARRRGRGRPPKSSQKFEGESSNKSEILESVKVNLPPSSSDLDLDGVNPFDLFSVFTCLRSFSRALFLSPFKLECFLSALRSEKANYLIDSIHFSIFKALKEHLQFLFSNQSQPGSQSASICLRNINWDRLDYITWPVFLLNYLVIHASAMDSEVKLRELNLLDVEYYKQPVGVKLKILRYLCDDVIEVHSVKSEIDRLDCEFNEDVNSSQTGNRRNKKKSSPNLIVDSEIVEGMQETNDGNIDECCLCTMDGNLICCDGCPAAFHSKCVGVVKERLPEGDWYCPECVVKRSEGLMKLSKLSGAELLGIDPHGRLYFGSCDRLLVSDSYDSYTSYRYYNKNDLYAVITALKSSYVYTEILNSIAMYWGFSIDDYVSSNQFQNNVHLKKEDLEIEAQSTLILLSEYNIPTDVYAEKPVVNSPSCKQVDKATSQVPNLISEIITEESRSADSMQPKLISLSDGNAGMLVLENSICAEQADQENFQVPNMVIEPLAENIPCADLVQSTPMPYSEHNVSDNMNVEKNAESPNSMKQDVPENFQFPDSVSVPITPDTHAPNLVQSPQQNTNNGTIDYVSAAEQFDSNRADLNDKKGDEKMDVQCDPQNYINYYSFGRIALSICEELKLNIPEVKDDTSVKPAPIKSIDDIKSLQLQAICNKLDKGYCYAYRKLSINVERENCDWCFSCRYLDDFDCLFKVAGSKETKDSKDGESEGFNTFQKVGPSHVDSAMCHILSIEYRARSLLSGPWVKPHYSQHWHQIVTEASDVASLKQLLLTLELNLRRVVLSTEWFKSVDDTHAIVSSCIVTSPIRSSRCSSKKRGKRNVTADEPTSIPDGGKLSDIYWWRGGRLSRQVFQCKAVPCSLALKGGRQAGYKVIPDILYPANSEVAKRSKCVSWRTAVEMSKSMAELIYHAKDLDSHVKWGELSSSGYLTKSGKESKKMAKLLKNVFICGKCNDGKQMKYLVDCGKKEILPSFITKHGELLEDSTVDRKRFWLSEAHVPLNLLKAYEEKNIKKKMARLLKKPDFESSTVKGSETKSSKRKQSNDTEVEPNILNENEWNAKRRKRSSGISFLFSRREDSHKVLCQQCNKDVLVREAINCQFCDGLFHKKHVRGPKTATTTINFTCTNCKNTKCVNMEEKGRKGPKSKDTDAKGIKGKGKGPIDMGAKIKDTINMEELGSDVNSEGESVKYVNINKIHYTEMTTRRANRKIQETSSTNKDNSIERLNLRRMNSKNTNSPNGKEFQKEVKPLKLKIKFQGRSIAPTTTDSLENNFSAITENRKLVLKLSQKSCSPKKSEESKCKGKRSERLKKKKIWNKRKRSTVHHSYWLNGLLWTPKKVTEQQMHFRKENVILPLQNKEEPVLSPMCCLCHKEYDAGVIYIHCELCHDWFHGDAFSLTHENIDNLIGFRCHKCRKRSEPVCPFLNTAHFHATNLGTTVSEGNCDHDIDKDPKFKDKNIGYSDETLSKNGHMDGLEKSHGKSMEHYSVACCPKINSVS